MRGKLLWNFRRTLRHWDMWVVQVPLYNIYATSCIHSVCNPGLHVWLVAVLLGLSISQNCWWCQGLCVGFSVCRALCNVHVYAVWWCSPKHTRSVIKCPVRCLSLCHDWPLNSSFNMLINWKLPNLKLFSSPILYDSITVLQMSNNDHFWDGS